MGVNNSFVIVLLAVVTLGAGLTIVNDYCNLKSCRGQPHTACLFNLTEKPKCSKLLAMGLSEQQKKRIVDLHNILRQKVASGRELRGAPGPQPAARYMANLTWDNELANIAQIHANQCKFQHDKCRNTRTNYVGQNIAYRATTGDVNTVTIDQLINLWYEEVTIFDKNAIYRPFSENLISNKTRVIGHYTQFVWAKTNKVGCGAVKYNNGTFNHFMLTCDYSPGGNVLGERIYETR